MKIHYLAAIAAGLLMVSNIAASNEKMEQVGAGIYSCGKFIADTEDIERLGNFYFFWAQGFLSGLNFEYFWNVKNATDLSEHEALKLWIENYCKDNPLDSYGAANLALWIELRDRQGLEPDQRFFRRD